MLRWHLRFRAYMATLLPYYVPHLMWFACFPAEVIASLREVETSLGEVRVPLISSIASVVRSSGFVATQPKASSSSGALTSMDVRALKALEVMKSCHDWILSVELLSVVREHYSIPSEYVLHAPALGQQPYDSFPNGFSISTDALEVGLRFALHPMTEECIGKATEASGKHPTEETSGPRKKAKVIGQHKSHREGEGSKSQAAKGKGPSSPADEASVPRTRPKLVRELCSARLRVDDKDYHVVRMNLARWDDFDKVYVGAADPSVGYRPQLNLSHNNEALKVDLPKEAVADYKKSTGFEMGLNCYEDTVVLKQVVKRGKKATMSPEGLSYQKSKVSVRKEVDSEEHHSAAEVDLPIAKKGMQMQGNG
ncbi:hypothetical protein BHM03_00017454 [Ensete ventricosum]|nr:hypothetical protein BHM03_00017454 [Ensete ventricosum]